MRTEILGQPKSSFRSFHKMYRKTQTNFFASLVFCIKIPVYGKQKIMKVVDIEVFLEEWENECFPENGKHHKSCGNSITSRQEEF